MTDPLINTHESFDPKSGSFAKKADAEATATRLREGLGMLFADFPEKAVVVLGKNGFYLVAFPRIHEYWWPASNDPRLIFGELTRIHGEFSTVFERKDP